MNDKDSNNNEDSTWVDDVLTRALEESYNQPPKFTPTEEPKEDTSEFNDSVRSVAEKSDEPVTSPYPDDLDGYVENDVDTTPTDKKVRSTLEWLAVIVGALLVAFLIKSFLMQAYYIPSSSMTPTLQVGDRVLVNKLSYEFGNISRGDLIVFKKPSNGTGDEPDLIKRVIALEGEVIEILDGKIFIIERNSTERKLLEEPYLSEGVSTNSFIDTSSCAEATETTCLIPEDHIFVMGDNRNGSRDSRYFGPVPEDNVVGRAFIRIWPLGSLKLL
ncbi:MAG: signal peptidase I [Acidimicrobiales bacterium]|jgi:signal peptidase I|nr:signal peptidase I [Acidimicrobiales bacterium]